MSKPKILVIEDERAVRGARGQPEARGVRRAGVLRWPGWSRQAQLKLPDLIVLDLMLPVKPGLDVCRDLRMGTRTRDIPIVMVTAKAEESDSWSASPWAPTTT